MYTILYVDDEPSLLETGKIFLERSGKFSVDIVTSAPAAITLLNTKNYDAIIADYQMPCMDGIEFLKRIRSSGNIIPFILFTGRGREEVVIQALNEGADFYLQKGGDPIAQFTELEYKIRQAVQQRMAEANIRDLERRQADIINFLPDATFAIDTHGVVITWNRAIEEKTGVSAAEMIGKGNYEYAIPFYGQRRPILIDLIYESDEVIAKEYTHIIQEKDILIAETTLPRPKGKAVTLVGKASPLYNRQGNIIGAIETIRDITELKRAEIYRQLSLDILGLLNEPREFNEIIRDVLDAVKTVTGADAVGIRLKAGDDFPYYIQSGFSNGFLLKENTLVEHDQDGRICRDANGNVRLECTCGLVVSGKFDPSNPLFTPSGTCWTNNSFPLLELPETEDPRYHPRNTCIHEGYASVALVPIRTMKKQIIGVLQINAIRKNCFTLDAIQGLELIAGHIGEALLRWQAQEALHESEKRYRTILNQASDSIIIHDLSGRIVDINRKTVENLGYTKDELRSMTIADIDPDAMVTGKDRFWVDVIQDKSVTFESSHKRKNGSILPVEVTLGRVDFKTGTHVIEIVRDITERKRAEEILRESEQRYRNVVEEQTEFICRFRPDGTHNFVNEAYCRYFGMKREEMLGHRFRPNIPTEDQMRVKPFFKSLTPDHPVDVIEHRIIIPDGSIRWQRWSDHAIFDPSGMIIEYQSVGRDITDRINAEEALKESQIQLAEAMDLANLVNWEFDIASGIFTFNDRFYALYGTTAEREGGYQMPAEVYAREFVHPDEASLVAKEVQNAINTTDPNYERQIEHRIIRRDGEIRHIIVRIAITKDAEGRTIKTHGANQDITERKLVEESLQKSESRWRQWLEQSPVPMALYKLDGKVLFANKQFVNVVGWTIDDNPRFDDWLRSVYPDQQYREQEKEKWINRIKTAISTGEYIEPYETRIFCKDGITRVLEFSGLVINDTILGTFYDLTTHKQAEKDLLRKNEEFNAAYEQLTAVEEELRTNLNDLANSHKALAENKAILDSIIGESPIPQFVIDRNHRITHWNKALAEYSGVKAESVIGTTEQWRAFYDTERPCLADLLLDGAVDKISAWYEGKFKKSILIDDAYEAIDFFPRMTEEGKWLYFTAGLIRDPEGKVIGAIETLEDITDRKQAEEALRREHEKLDSAFEQLTATEEELRTNYDNLTQSQKFLQESEERYRMLYDENPFMYFTIDADGIVVSVNPYGAEQLGYSVPELLGQPVLSVFYPDDRDAVMGQVAKCLEKMGEILIWEFRKVKKDGTVIWVREVARAVRRAGDTPIILIVCEDITDQKQTREALSQAIKKLNILNSITRHDILNQLTVLKGYLELSKEVGHKPAKLSEFIKKEITAAESIEEQIGFTRDYQNMGVNAPTWLNVNASISRAVAALPMKNVRVEVDCPEYEVLADALFEKVFYNLIDNALRHGGKKLTTIRFLSHESDRGLIIVCENDGVGISRKVKEHLFERGVGKHTGLGLNLVREILSITGITISETGKYGKGVRFEILVPTGKYRFADPVKE